MNRLFLYNHRRYFSATLGRLYKIEGPSASTGHEGKGGGTVFKMISLCVAVPVIIALSAIVVMYGEEKKRTPFVKYEYLRRRTKRFPWGDGDHSLFHSPKYNAIPTGYEYEEEEDEEETEE